MQNGIYLTKTDQDLKLLHIEEGEVLDVLIETGAPLVGTLYMGRVSAKDGPSFWVHIGLQKPALLQHPRQNYQVGQRVLVQLKRPPLIEKYLTKNAEVSDAISVSGDFLYYTPGKKGIHFSSQIRDKDWRSSTLEALNAVAENEEGIVLKGLSYGKNVKLITQDLHDVRLRWQQVQQDYQAAEKIGQVIHQGEAPWVSYVLDHKKEPIFTDNADLVVLLKQKNVSEKRLNFSLKPSWKVLLTESLDALLEEQVPLRGGGYLIVEEGHTLTAIDVNTTASGDTQLTLGVKLTSDNARFEFAQLALNESIRQLYLRKIGGIVVIDLPRLSNLKHQKALLKTAKSYEDSSLQVLGLTKSGLLEMTKRKDEMSLKQIFEGGER
ncbi:MAG TPA: hypothetical protein DD412_03060 [Holosporales bacterium]|nr:hypothetical protein [Holosporales bacterium]